jgi:hypothetical protein
MAGWCIYGNFPFLGEFINFCIILYISGAVPQTVGFAGQWYLQKLFTLTSAELQINDEQGKHSNSAIQDSEKVQNVVFDSANNTEHSILGKMSNKSDTVCKDSDNSTKSPQVTHHKQTNNYKNSQDKIWWLFMDLTYTHTRVNGYT